MIHDIELTTLAEIKDSRGSVKHFIKSTDEDFVSFGEVYLSTVKCNVVKGWKKNLDVDQNFCCIQGIIKVVIYDDRNDSVSRGSIHAIILDSESTHSRLKIPKDLWYSFKCCSEETSTLLNFISTPHKFNRVKTLPISSSLIPFEWRE